MGIRVRLSTEIYKHYEYAMKKAKIEITSASPIMELHADTYENTLVSLQKLYDKTMNTKTKNFMHMERLHAIQHVISEATKMAIYFPKKEVEQLAANSDGIDESEGADVA